MDNIEEFKNKRLATLNGLDKTAGRKVRKYARPLDAMEDFLGNKDHNQHYSGYNEMPNKEEAN
jgi:hypothetical protein